MLRAALAVSFASAVATGCAHPAADASGCAHPVADTPAGSGLATSCPDVGTSSAGAGAGSSTSSASPADAEPVFVGQIDVGSVKRKSTRAWLAQNQVESNGVAGVDDDGDGFVDDVWGMTLYPYSKPSDILDAPTSVAHAERVLGEMAAVWRRSPPARPVRVVVALEVPTAPAKKTPEGAVVTESHAIESGLITARIAAAIDAFGARRVRIVNLSMGVSLDSTRAYFRLVGAGLGADPDARAAAVFGESAPVLRAAVERHPEMLFVVAAGNSGVDLDDAESAPLRSVFVELGRGAPNVLVVTATPCDPLADPAEDCVRRLDNHGVRSVHLCVRAESTSWATPRVTALGALLLAADPTQDTAALRAALLARAREVDALRGSVEAGRYLAIDLVVPLLGAAAGSFR